MSSRALSLKWKWNLRLKFKVFQEKKSHLLLSFYANISMFQDRMLREFTTLERESKHAAIRLLVQFDQNTVHFGECALSIQHWSGETNVFRLDFLPQCWRNFSSVFQKFGFKLIILPNESRIIINSKLKWLSISALKPHCMTFPGAKVIKTNARNFPFRKPSGRLRAQTPICFPFWFVFTNDFNQKKISVDVCDCRWVVEFGV